MEVFFISLMTMNQFNHFDFIAPLYDRFIKPADPVILRSVLNLPNSGVLLDAGGGTGRSSSQLLDFVGGVVIIDSSMGMLAQAGQKGRFCMVCSNSEDLPFQDSYYESVIMVDALHHVRDYRQTLHELWRVVKPGGQIVIEEPDVRTFAGKIIAVFEKLVLMRSHFISPVKISDFLSELGCTSRIMVVKNTAWIISEKPSDFSS
jgi:demethylmenaquinone methyltransferase/2-methoxy-6-polyprenyl-1,4-benzoquinol methylase